MATISLALTLNFQGGRLGIAGRERSLPDAVGALSQFLRFFTRDMKSSGPLKRVSPDEPSLLESLD